MTDKAYIVANKQQELDVLKRFEQNGLVWFSEEKSTEFVPSESSLFNIFLGFPYVLMERKSISWSSITQLTDETIVYDGRKEEKMDKKYKVTQKFMDELNIWRDKWGGDNGYVDGFLIDILPGVVESWRFKDNSIERNNRLIAIIKWLNGEDVFEVEKPRKFVVRSENTDRDGDYNYVKVFNRIASPVHSQYATKFNTREKAQEWANAHQVVVEIDEDGNEAE